MTITPKLALLISCLAAPWALAEKVEVPILIDVGAGPALVEFNTPAAAADQAIYGLKLQASAMIEKETIKKFKNKIPDEVPKWLINDGVSVSPWWIPKTLYITPGGEGDASVYGIRIAPDLGVGFNFGPITLRTAAGIDLAYMYLDSSEFTEHHFISPGVHINYEIALEPFKYVQIAIGQDRQRYWGKNLSNGEKLNSATETYVRVNIRIPFSVKADL